MLVLPQQVGESCTKHKKYIMSTLMMFYEETLHCARPYETGKRSAFSWSLEKSSLKISPVHMPQCTHWVQTVRSGQTARNSN